MASRESSVSEGEVLETTHKANNASSHPRESAIDDSSRAFGLDGAADRKDYTGGRIRSPSPRPRSPSPYRRKIDRSPSPYRRARDRSRSPSPFRRDRRGSRDSRDYDGRHRQLNKRKASPYRNSRPEKRYNADRGKTYDRHEPPHRGRDYRIDRAHPPPPRLSYADNEEPPTVPDFRQRISYGESARKDATNGNKHQPQPQKSHKNSTDSAKIARNMAHSTNPSTKPSQNVDVEMTNVNDNAPESVPAVEDQVPTEESREEKKRRWAAKRAQLAAEKTNLLQQVLVTNASENTTPDIGSPLGSFGTPNSPLSGSPRETTLNFVPASPDVMVVDKDEAYEAASPAADGPSAANYDPTEDMLQDRVRAEQKAQKAQQSEMSATAYDETNPKMLSALPAEKARPAKKKKKELDMFAFSDDEDEGDEEEDTGEEQEVATKGTVLDAKLLDNWDDPDGYYKIISNELVNAGRYRMVKGLGRGVFANVAQAEDVKSQQSGELVAIKIVRRNDAMKKASQKEIDFLRRLNEADPQDKRHIIRFLGSFDHKGHLCIIFEHMSKNLRDLLKEETSGHGLSLQAVKTYSRQMFSGLKHLQDCQIIHADIKPDNILVSLDKKTIKLADLGTAADKRDNNEPTPYLVSRFYRAPEIILGMEIGYGVDMWAIGCTMYELWTGKILFPGRSNNQMIKVILECMGWPSEKLLKKGQLSGVHFEAGPPLKLVSCEVDQFGNPFIRKIEQHRLANRNLKTRVHDASRGITGNGPTATELNDFADLLAATLNWNYEKRIQPKEAVTHKFFGAKPLAPRTAVVKPVMMKRRK